MTPPLPYPSIPQRLQQLLLRQHPIPNRTATVLPKPSLVPNQTKRNTITNTNTNAKANTRRRISTNTVSSGSTISVWKTTQTAVLVSLLSTVVRSFSLDSTPTATTSSSSPRSTHTSSSSSSSNSNSHRGRRRSTSVSNHPSSHNQQFGLGYGSGTALFNYDFHTRWFGRWTHLEELPQQPRFVRHMSSSSSSSSSNQPQSQKQQPLQQPLQQPPQRPPQLVIVLAGPTAVGKSAVAARLCESSFATSLLHSHSLHNPTPNPNSTPNDLPSSKTRGHVISADSVQTYRGVHIGANKPTQEEQIQTPHHLIDVLEEESVCEYSAAEWMDDARFVIDCLTGGGGGAVEKSETNEPMEKRPKLESSYPSSSSPSTTTTTTTTTTIPKNEINHPNTIPPPPTNEQLLQRRTTILSHIQKHRPNPSSSSSQPPILPVVVGGTMMYLQWLIHGRPDAVKPTFEAKQTANRVVDSFREEMMEINHHHHNDTTPSHTTTNEEEDDDEQKERIRTQQWNNALSFTKSTLGPPFSTRIEKLTPGDWYRLRRTLEVAYTLQPSATSTGIHTTDDPTTSISSLDPNGPSSPSSPPSQSSSAELYTGLRTGGLGTNTNTNTHNYDVRCFFLCPSNRFTHASLIDARCEDMLLRGLLTETTNLRTCGKLPEGGQTEKAIGYRQTLSYLETTPKEATTTTNEGGGGGEPKEVEKKKEEARFDTYLEEFQSATRRYAKKQTSWFRKDPAFVFVPVRSCTDDDNDNDDNNNDTNTDPLDEVCEQIRTLCTVERRIYDQERTGEINNGDGDSSTTTTVSAETKRRHEEQGKGMKFYRSERHRLKKGSRELEELLSEVKECRERLERYRSSLSSS